MTRLVLALLIFGWAVQARELYPGQYDSVDPKIRQWFQSQRSPSGMLCCSRADGVYAEEDIRGTHYWTRWRINDVLTDWQQVPEETVIYNSGNPNGSAVVWYWFADGAPRIRCFVPGGGV